MNERQKKIMVPYQEPMDTCPDCSNHPCDCGLPAGYEVDIRFAANFAPHIKVMEASKVAEIIEQRDRLAEAMGEIAYQKLSDELDDYTYEHANWEASWDYIINLARKSLQSLNSDHTVAANDMIAAVKRGSDES